MITMIYQLTKEHLTEDDLKVLKHLKAIDNLFKKGDLTIYQLFMDNGTLKVTKIENDEEYEIDNFYNITCDGGDPDRCGNYGISNSDELEKYYESKEEGE